tara:strand:+ start:98 stop:361 length:264 start_codon:yes stop_codon:yes gene_type:complete
VLTELCHERIERKIIECHVLLQTKKARRNSLSPNEKDPMISLPDNNLNAAIESFVYIGIIGKNRPLFPIANGIYHGRGNKIVFCLEI